MNIELNRIRRAIAVAQRELAHLIETSPEEIRNLPEIDDLDLGLAWTMKRTDKIRAHLEQCQASHHEMAS